MLQPSLPPGFNPQKRSTEPTAFDTVRATVSRLGRARAPQVLAQMHELGNRSLFFICVVLGFVGAIFVYQSGVQNLRVLPDLSGLGGAYIELLIRDLAATIGALMLATRVGAGIAAELGSMKVTEQLDALRLCHAEPIDYLVVPRVIACVLVTPLLVILGAAVALVTGLITAQTAFGLQARTFLDLSFVDASDVTLGLLKSIAYGAAVPLASAHAGLTAPGGSQGVGEATTAAVVRSSMAVIVINFVLSGVWLLLFGG